MENQKTALITGVGGQDGYYLAKLLVEKGYKVHGLLREKSQRDIGTVKYLPEEIKKKVHLAWGNINDYSFMIHYLREIKPDEIYHLAAHSFVGTSFNSPVTTYDTNIMGTLNIVDTVRHFLPKCRVYFAGTSEQFGGCKDKKMSESSEFVPRSPYAVAKLAGFQTMKVYRESFGLYMCSGVLFNHESEMRGPHFVSRKITLAVANIKKGKQECLEIGNMDSKRDWGHAEEYVKGMWMILQQEKPDDFVLATGECHTVREFIEESFKHVGMNIIWSGSGDSEIGTDEKSGVVRVRVKKEFFRPLEVDYLNGDYEKAKTKMGWEPTIKYKELVKRMMDYDLTNDFESCI